jgi:predicted short-subunit dehydrogenase-like oxidoreductase (DUF2520 family)
MRISIVGTGRAGTSFAGALGAVGHEVQLLSHRELAQLDSPDVVMLCVPDDEIARVAREIVPSEEFVLCHVAGSRTLDVLGGHEREGSLHPLTTLPSGDLGAKRLLGATYCVSGDEAVLRVVESLGGRVLTLRDEQRTLYHATATAASNHLVALMGHVQRLAESAGLRLEDFLALSRQAFEDVLEVGPGRALTGPASRGDLATIDAHLAALEDAERSTYVALAHAAFELAEQRSSSIA